MSAEANIKVIQDVYAAFGRGDAAFILDACTDDVDWSTETASTAVPWWGPKHGKAEVGAFFQEFGSNMTVEDFTPLSFAANETEVFTRVRFATTRIANGKSAATHLHHYFRMRDGKIAFYRGSEDTAQVAALFA